MPDEQQDETVNYELRKLKTEFAEMAERAAQEVANLEARINQLLPLARAYESIDTILRIGQQQQANAPSLSWRLSGRAIELRKELSE